MTEVSDHHWKPSDRSGCATIVLRGLRAIVPEDEPTYLPRSVPASCAWHDDRGCVIEAAALEVPGSWLLLDHFVCTIVRFVVSRKGWTIWN